MQLRETELPGVLEVVPAVFEDSRGYFFEAYHAAKLAGLGLRAQFVQDNQSRSVRHTLRGLHYQLARPQAKLVRVLSGEILDVAVDLRQGSPTCGRYVARRLSAENRHQLFVPRGFAHGFLVLSASAEVLYKCDAYYDGGDQRGVRWDDPDLGIPWGIADPVLSEKDRLNPFLRDLSAEDLPVYGGRGS
jgi:dTDP-4-dehydrorhamnose 3,5-epimerase